MRSGCVAPQVNEKYCRIDGDVPRLHHTSKHQFAKRASIWVHPARPNAGCSERKTQGSAQDHGQMVLPATLADRGTVLRHEVRI
jgi:hypothetical protein